MKRFLLSLTIVCLINLLAFTQGMIQNGDFENGTSGQVDYWTKTSWSTNGTTFKWEIGQGRNNSNCISISVDSNTPNDARFLQQIDSLVPNAWYRITGWIKGQNVTSQTNDGANICLYGTWDHTKKLKRYLWLD